MDNLVNIFTKIAGKALRVWLLIILTGLLLCLVSLITAIIFLLSGISSGFSGDWHSFSSVIKSLTALVWFAFPTVLLLVTSIIVFPVSYFVVANKTATQTVMYEVFKNHLAPWVDSKINDYLSFLQTCQPEWMKQLTDGTSLKMKLLQINKDDKTGLKIQRHIVKYFLKKLNLEKIDLPDKNLDIGQLLINQINKNISELTEPSLLLFGLLVLLQVMLLIIVIWV